MAKVLIIGLFDASKTAIIRAVKSCGFAAFNLDAPDWSHWAEARPADGLTPAEGKDWAWQEDGVRALLSVQRDDLLFISGCAENMHRLYPLIDRIILQSAPIDTIMVRPEKLM